MPPKPSLIRPSTGAFAREARQTAGYSWFQLLHGYVYGRWPFLYIRIATGEHPLARLFGPPVRALGRLARALRSDDPERVTFADTYHGKVVPLDAARQLVTVQQDITVTDLEQVIPYRRARAIVLQNPDHIAVIECPCRSSRSNPCRPLDVCLIVGEPFASFILEHHPRRARQISSQEAEEILAAEQQRGHVSHAFFRDVMFGRFYAICNCCSCCCGAMRAHQHGSPMLASSGFVAQVDGESCAGCGVCVEQCQFSALRLDDQGRATVEPEQCMGCGVCVHHCSQGAVTLVRDPSRGEPLEIRRLIAEATACS